MARGITFAAKLITRPAYRALQQIRNLGEDQTPLLDAWGGILEGSTRGRFDSGRGPGGVPWPVSERVRKHGGKTLVDKGNLERSIRYAVDGPHRLLVGVDGRSESAKNAAAHQFGVNRPVIVGGHFRVIDSAFGVPLQASVRVRVRTHGRKMYIPARPFLGVDNEDRRQMTDAAQDYLRSLLRL